MQKRTLIWLAALAAVAVAWGVYLCLGGAVSHWVAAQMGERILAAADGKISDPARFVQGRLWEVVWLLTWGVGLAGLFHAVVARSRSCLAWVRWLVLSLTLFGLFNVASWAGGRTVLFWTLLWKGSGGWQNLAQHEIKRLLLAENPVRPQIALLGSSQTRAQIDEALLNRLGQGRWWATDLHFPGNQCLDMAITWRRLADPKPGVAVIYLSEGSFYSGVESEGLRAFFGLADLPLWRDSGGRLTDVPPALAYGVLGDVLPLFRMRDTFSQRVLGHEIVALPQKQHDTSLAADLRARADMAAAKYQDQPTVVLQQRALEHLARECQRSSTRLVLVAGQVNPILQERLDPKLRPAMLEYLRKLARQYPNVLVLAPEELTAQSQGDYLDLTHVTPETQAQFTRYLATRLERILTVP